MPLTRDERMHGVLMSIVEAYIATAEPVSSRGVIERSALSVSSATVRSDMAALEAAGLLEQPHTSAGRVPTERAFRLYVDGLLGSRLPTSTVMRSLERRLARVPARKRLGARSEPAASAVGPSIERATDLLSRVTGQIAFFVCGPGDDARLAHVHFVRVSSERVMALLVDRTGAVQSRVFEDREGGQRDLDRASETLSELVVGLTLAGARQRLEREIERERARSDSLVRRACTLGVAGLEGVDQTGASELYVSDRNRLLAHPEFADVEQLREVLALLEEKQRLKRLLDKILQPGALRVVIGRELDDPHIRPCAVVSAPVAGAAGGIGVIGPVRMRYDRIIPTVRVLSERVGVYLD
jgi:heat-inducible transcriptional repressor